MQPAQTTRTAAAASILSFMANVSMGRRGSCWQTTRLRRAYAPQAALSTRGWTDIELARAPRSGPSRHQATRPFGHAPRRGRGARVLAPYSRRSRVEADVFYTGTVVERILHCHMNQPALDETTWIPMVFGCLFGVPVLVWLLRAFRFRKTLCPIEHGRHALWTTFPRAVHLNGWQFSGPFSRVSLYDDMLVLRALGLTTILRREDLLAQPTLRGPWIVLRVRIGRLESEIRLSTDANRERMERIEEWRLRNG
jgi:hypothetical protein